MTGKVSGRKPTRNRPADAPPGKGRKHRWTRRILFGVVALLALVVLGSWAFIKLQPTLPPLALSAASPPVGALDGTWAVSAGSVAGFRVPETAFGMSNNTVGRTTAVSGTVVISGNRVTSATVRIDLAALKVNGKAQPQFAKSLDTRTFPDATFTLAKPAELGSPFASGATVRVTAAGRLTSGRCHAPGDRHGLGAPRRIGAPGRRIDPRHVLRLGHQGPRRVRRFRLAGQSRDGRGSWSACIDCNGRPAPGPGPKVLRDKAECPWPTRTLV